MKFETQGSVTALDSILDILYQLIPLLEKFDNLHSTDHNLLQSLRDQVARIDAEIKEWEAGLVRSGCLASRWSISNVQVTSTCFADLQTAAALLYKDVCQIHLDNLLIGLLSQTSPKLQLETFLTIFELWTDRWECMARICSLFDYFFSDDKRLSGRMIFLLLFQTGLVGIPDCEEGYDEPFIRQAQICALTCTRIAKEGYLPWNECADRWTRLKDKYVNIQRYVTGLSSYRRN